MSTRRQAIRQMALIGVGLTLSGTTSGLLASSPGYQKVHEDKLIRAFMEAVVPGAPVNHPDITLPFRDKIYGFSKYRWLFNFDLRKRSWNIFGSGKFHQLTILERKEVIEDALRTKGKIMFLYSGAIQLTQATVYSGFYCEPAGCPIIEFQPRFKGGETSYPNANQFLGRSMTINGNIP